MIALAILLAAPEAPAHLSDAETMFRIPLPPIRFRGDITVLVHFVEPSKLPTVCGMKVEAGQVLLGCARVGQKEMWVSNPCLSLDQLYAKELCHEIAHSATPGWPADHGP